METKTAPHTEKETIKDSAEDLVKHITDYTETWYKRTMLQLTHKAVKTGAGILSGFITLIIGLIVFFFLNMALGWWLGDLVESRPLGFLLLGGFYLLILVIILAAKKGVVKSLRNMLIRMIYD